ncbi:RHS repeat-associated core domain-containing protein [Roseateles sp. UC29_93]|uniref:RHS repeat-associated core domain-containing protein n=1 Tax=Roseateles sp. UC29_93 TaxID=3350177 RepID=UPI00366AD841
MEAKAKTAWGGLESEQLQNGFVESHKVDGVTGQLFTLRAGTGGNAQAVDRTHTWDVQGNLTQRIDGVGDAVAGPITETFVYGDALNRLTSYTVAANAVPNGSRTVTMTYNALGMMLSKSDAAGFVYGAQGPTSVRPHAVQQVLGSTGGSYVYDDAGNLLSAGGAKYSAIRYTSFNLPDGQDGLQGNGTRYQWQYDESTARIRETRTVGGATRTTWYLHPDNQGGLGFERESGGTGGDLNRHYISTGSSTLVLITSGALPTLASGQTQPSGLGSVLAGKLEYWHKDHLGSIVATTDQTGAVTARYAYDPFGKRRYVNGRYDDFGNIVVDWNGTAAGATDRGFTGHEHLDDVGIVHMNGRLFDPNLGVFLQPDPFIQSSGNLQDYQRYGYCSSNPMTCTDPTGYFKFSDIFTGGKTLGPGSFFSNFFLTSMSDPLQYWTYRTVARNKVGYQIGSIAIGVLSAYCNGLAPVCAAVGAAEWSGFAGNSIDQNIRAGAFAGISAYANTLIGDTFKNYYANVAAHAAWGCAESKASGGNCGSGAWSGALSTIWAHEGAEFSGGSKVGDMVANTMTNALVGGSISALTGGNFWVGARSAAFSYLFNYLKHSAGAENTSRN